ncbi:MAG: radical SAM family heme chaperone HemW, partial [Candidatus Korobacteraceae bacterium]
MPQGIYISVPFCRTKCSFCNFASGVFSRALFERYVNQVCAEIEAAEDMAHELGGRLDRHVDSIYLGGGTPSVLAPDQLERLFAAVSAKFEVERTAEITVECAPGTVTDEILESLLRCGVNRVSLGVQSFVDRESSSVGRLHTRAITLDDIARLRSGGIGNASIDLIAGLPHQTEESWQLSLSETLATGVPHVSVYMLEVDEDSRLGTELLAGGSRYHAHFVPDDDRTADLYLAACERLERGGVRQYEISNFARPVTHGIGLHDSRHNLKYWTRQPYLGFGVDAHSMLVAGDDLRAKGVEAVRFATPDSLEGYAAASGAAFRAEQLLASRTLVNAQAALEESFFLGLRLNNGVSLSQIRNHFGDSAIGNS